MEQFIVSARKYRPNSFETLLGQETIARTLKNSIQRGQLAHAYLFCGPRGVGKTSAARIFAKTINCSNPGPDLEPCGECESCRSFAEGRSYSIHELDAASNNSVDDIRALTDKVRIPPQVGRYSVYIIDEVHMLSQQAFNAFLKTLEEPPAHAIFILATTEKHKILPTILSRCQTYDFNRISVEDMVRNMKSIAEKEGVAMSEDAMHIIAQKADGAMRDALTLFDQTVAFCGKEVTYDQVIRNLGVPDYEYGFKLVDASLAGDYASALLLFNDVLAKGFNAQHFVAAVSSHLRDLLVSRTGGLEALLDLPDSLRAKYREQGERCSVKWLYDALGVTTACEAGYRLATNPRLHIEFALMKLAFLQNQPAAQQAPETSGVAGIRARAHASDSALRAIPLEGVQGVKADSSAKQTGGHGFQEQHSATAPKKPSANIEKIEIPVEQPATAGNSSVSQPAPEEKPAEEKKPRRAKKSAASLSLSALMSEDEPEVMPASEEVSEGEKALPGDEELAAKWTDLAAQYTGQPRLANALTNANLSFGEEAGRKVVYFTVTNEAQKKWIEERVLRDLEGRFSKIVDCGKIRLEPTVVPEEAQGKRIYMPSEKAEDLMSKNEEVRNLVVDLALDIK